MAFLKTEILQLLFCVNECKGFYTFPLFSAYICMNFVERNQSCLFWQAWKVKLLPQYENKHIKKLPEVTDHAWFLPWVSDNGNSPIPHYSSNIWKNYVNLYHFSNKNVKWTITCKTQWPKAVRANITRWKPGTAPHPRVCQWHKPGSAALPASDHSSHPQKAISHHEIPSQSTE